MHGRDLYLGPPRGAERTLATYLESLGISDTPTERHQPNQTSQRHRGQNRLSVVGALLAKHPRFLV